jgi:hypothetical protein
VAGHTPQMHPRVSGLLKAGAVAVAVLTLSTAAALWAGMSVVAQVGGSMDLGPDSGGDLGLVLSDTQEAVTAASAAIRDTAVLGEGLQEGSAQTARALSSAGALIEGDVADSLSSVQEAMPAIVDAGRVIDSTLRALSLFGVEYDPPVPFDEALIDVEAGLDGLPDSIRSQGQQIAALAPTIASTATDIAIVADSLSEMADELDDVSERLEALEVPASRIDSLRAIIAGTEGARAVFGGLLGLAVGSGLVLAVVLWRLSNTLMVSAERSTATVDA